MIERWRHVHFLILCDFGIPTINLLVQKDLKDRYYFCTKTLLNARNPMADPATKAEIELFNFDKG